MHADVEDRDSVWSALYERHLADGLAELWDSLNADGSGLRGEEVAEALNGRGSVTARAFKLVDVILKRAEQHARDRADEEIDPALRAMRSARRSDGLLRGEEREEAQDLG